MSCQRVSYADFSDKIYSESTKKRIPLAATIELTMRCNISCDHCYCVSDKSKKELTTDQWKNIIDQITDAGCLWLLITGGEPLLRPDFIEIYLYAKKKGLIVSLFTNGILVNESIAQMLKENSPFKLEITVYGSNNQVYENVCGLKNGFSKLKKGLELLEKHTVPYQLKTLVTDKNINDYQNIMSIIKGFAEYRFDGLLSPKINGDITSTDVRLNASAIVEMEFKEEKIKNAWQDVLERVDIQLDKDSDALACMVGVNNFNIDPYGNLQLCGMLQKPSYDLVMGNFKEGWERLADMREMFPKVDAGCHGCKEAVFCENCPGWSWLEHSNYSQPSEFLCNVAKKRSEVYFNNKSS